MATAARVVDKTFLVLACCRRSWWRVLAMAFALALCGCWSGREQGAEAIPPTPNLDGIARERRQVRFASQGVTLAGELDLPLGDTRAPLVFGSASS